MGDEVVLPHRNVVVGTDGSATATEAVRRAAALAKVSRSRLTVVAAFERSGDEGRPGAPNEPGPWQATAAGKAEIAARDGAALARNLGVEEVDHRSVQGQPADVLVGTAQEIGADLLVVGSRGMRSVSRFMLGSVANRVSHHAPCDVLIVHTAN